MLAAAVDSSAASGSFPALIELSSLDGTNGFVLNGVKDLDLSGQSVSGAGDVNDDGIDDLIIGAFHSGHDGRVRAGKSYVVFGRATGFPATFELLRLYPQAGGDGSAGLLLKGIDATDYAGGSVSGTGDVNGDGVDDLLIGAAGASPNGETYVVFGRATGFPAAFELRSLDPGAGGDGSAGFILEGFDSSASSVSGAGDVNGDGIDDLLIGATGADPHDRIAAGETYVVFGRSTGFPPTFELRSLHPLAGGDGSAGFILEGRADQGFLGGSVSGAGDVNGDGTDDLIIGAAGENPNGQVDAGESYVVFGRATGFPAAYDLRRLHPDDGGDGSAGFILEGIDPEDKSGGEVSGAGDVNGDGIDDLLIGARFADPNGIKAGESYVVFGRPTGFPAIFALGSLDPQAGGDGSAGFVLEGMDARDYSGCSVSGAGDVNGDGIDDLLIGAFGADPNGRPEAGESYVVFGRATGFPAIFALRSLRPQAGGDGSAGFIVKGIDFGDISGDSVSSAGDVNGDGADDLIIGAYRADPNGKTRAGESYVVFGRGTLAEH